MDDKATAGVSPFGSAVQPVLGDLAHFELGIGVLSEGSRGIPGFAPNPGLDGVETFRRLVDVVEIGDIAMGAEQLDEAIAAVADSLRRCRREICGLQSRALPAPTQRTNHTIPPHQKIVDNKATLVGTELLI